MSIEVIEREFLIFMEKISEAELQRNPRLKGSAMEIWRLITELQADLEPDKYKKATKGVCQAMATDR